MTQIVVDPLRSAWHDDGTESGVQRVQAQRGPLVSIPIRSGLYGQRLTGTAAAGYTGSGILDNSDGTGAAVKLVVNAATAGTTQGAELWCPPIYGSTVGIRFRRDTSTSDFVVFVDGVAYPVTGQLTHLVAEGFTFADGESCVIVAEDLDPHLPHTVMVQLVGNTSTNAQLYVFGLLGDALAGHAPPVRRGQLSAVTATPTTQTAVFNFGGTSVNTTLRTIWYYNTTGSPITITLQVSSTTCYVKAVPATDTIVVDLGRDVAAVLLTHAASGAGLNFTTIGGY